MWAASKTSFCVIPVTEHELSYIFNFKFDRGSNNDLVFFRRRNGEPVKRGDLGDIGEGTRVYKWIEKDGVYPTENNLIGTLKGIVEVDIRP